MTSGRYLKAYAYYYIYATVAVIVLSITMSHAATWVSSMSALPSAVIIDPGHGDPDGGAVSVTGVKESRINLEIAQKLKDTLQLLGCDVLLLRNTDEGLQTQGNTVREKKVSDLSNRVSLINDHPGSILISIHQNYFSQERYSGPQVFYTASSEAKELAKLLQTSMNRTLAPNSARSCKQSSGVYLMEHIQVPGVLIECGFLSNYREAQLLQQQDYQRRIAAVIAATAASFLHSGIQA